MNNFSAGSFTFIHDSTVRQSNRQKSRASGILAPLCASRSREIVVTIADLTLLAKPALHSFRNVISNFGIVVFRRQRARAIPFWRPALGRIAWVVVYVQDGNIEEACGYVILVSDRPDTFLRITVIHPGFLLTRFGTPDHRRDVDAVACYVRMDIRSDDFAVPI